MICRRLKRFYIYKIEDFENLVRIVPNKFKGILNLKLKANFQFSIFLFLLILEGLFIKLKFISIFIARYLTDSLSLRGPVLTLRRGALRRVNTIPERNIFSVREKTKQTNNRSRAY